MWKWEMLPMKSLTIIYPLARIVKTGEKMNNTTETTGHILNGSAEKLELIDFSSVVHNEDTEREDPVHINQNITYVDAKPAPIHPNIFVKLLKNRVHTLEPRFKFGEQMLKGFYYYGATYNECLYRNINGCSPKRHTLPAPTGSAKSVSAKLYLSEIASMGYSGILVVGKVKNAIEAVQEINEIAKANIAACTYAISRTHPYCEQRVSTDLLKHYPIIVITHNMFLAKSSSTDNLGCFTQFDTKHRACVIIDEHIDFKRTVSISVEDIRDSIGLGKNIPGWGNVDNTLKMICESEIHSDLDTASHPDIPDIMREAIGQLQRKKGFVGLKKDQKHEDRAAADRDYLIRVLDKIHFIFSHKNIVVRQGKHFYYSASEDLTNKFGSVVILDATAKSSLIYKAHMYNRDDIRMYEMPRSIRNYQHATLHICHNKHYSQSNGKLVQHAKTHKTIHQIIDHYLKLLYTLVADGNKILVVTFLEIVDIFQSRCKDENIVFIHYGEHEGRNDFSDFSKAVAIGWFRKSKRKYIEDIDAIHDDILDYEPLAGTINQDTKAMISGGLAADLVQFFNRTRSRVAIDEQGNCAPVDFYMFDDGSYGSPVESITQEMPGIQIKEWTPVQAYPLIIKNKLENRSDAIIKFLLKTPGATIDAKSIRSHFNGVNAIQVSKKNLKDILSSEYFKALCEENDIDIITKRGRYGGTFFQTPDNFNSLAEIDKEFNKTVTSLMSS